MAVNLGASWSEQIERDRQQGLNVQQAYEAQRNRLTGGASPQQRLQQTDALFAQLRDMLTPRASGAEQPFSEQVQQGLFAGASDSAAGAMRGAGATIDRAFAAQGLAGSGGAMRARLDAQRQIGKQLANQQTQIRTNAALENQLAKERGQAAMLQFLPLQTQHNAAVSELSGDDPLTNALISYLRGGGGGGGIGANMLGRGGGGGAAGGFTAAEQDSLHAQWLRDQQATEDAAAAIRARNAAQGQLLGAGAAVGQAGAGAMDAVRRALYGAPNPFGGILKLAAGSDPGQRNTGMITGSGGTYSGSAEDMLAAIQRNRANAAPKLPTGPAKISVSRSTR